jgi:hypothetical protein
MRIQNPRDGITHVIITDHGRTVVMITKVNHGNRINHGRINNRMVNRTITQDHHRRIIDHSNRDQLQ